MHVCRRSISQTCSSERSSRRWGITPGSCLKTPVAKDRDASLAKQITKRKNERTKERKNERKEGRKCVPTNQSHNERGREGERVGERGGEREREGERARRRNAEKVFLTHSLTLCIPAALVLNTAPCPGKSCTQTLSCNASCPLTRQIPFPQSPDTACHLNCHQSVPVPEP